MAIKKNPKNSSARKLGEHSPWGFSISALSSFKNIENKHHVYLNKYHMKKFYKCLREHVMKITNFKKTKMKLLTNEQQKSYKNAKISHISSKNLK